MREATIAIVVLGLALAVALGISRGFDATAVVILVFLVAVGALGIGVANRAAGGQRGPADCPECGGVVSPNAPYCKHCGARL